MSNKFHVNNFGYRQLSNEDFVKLWQQSKTKNDFEQRLNSLIDLDRRCNSMGEAAFNQAVAEKRALVASQQDMLREYDILESWSARWDFRDNAGPEFSLAKSAREDLNRDLGRGDFARYLMRHRYSGYSSQVNRARRMIEKGVQLKNLKRIPTPYSGPKTDYSALNDYAQTFID